MFNFNFSKSVEEFKAAGSSLANGVGGLAKITGAALVAAPFVAVACSVIAPTVLPFVPLEVAIFTGTAKLVSVVSSLPLLGALSVATVAATFSDLVTDTAENLGSAVVNTAKAVYHAGEAIFGSNEGASNPTHQIEPKPDFGSEVEKVDSDFQEKAKLGYRSISEWEAKISPAHTVEENNFQELSKVGYYDISEWEAKLAGDDHSADVA